MNDLQEAFKGDIFLHKYTHKLYIYDGEVWRKIQMYVDLSREKLEQLYQTENDE